MPPSSHQVCRQTWNTPNQHDIYHVSHPLLGQKYIVERRQAFVEPDDSPHPWIQAAASNNSDRLLVLPGRPDVYVKKGLYGDPNARTVLATSDSDWHRPGDIVIIVGQIHCEVIQASKQNPNRTSSWNCEWWPDAVIRIAKMAVRGLPPFSSQLSGSLFMLTG